MRVVIYSFGKIVAPRTMKTRSSENILDQIFASFLRFGGRQLRAYPLFKLAVSERPKIPWIVLSLRFPLGHIKIYRL